MTSLRGSVSNSPTLTFEQDGSSPTKVDSYRLTLAGLVLRLTPLWNDIKTFSGWFENECRVVDTTDYQEPIRIEISNEGVARMAEGAELTPLHDWQRIWAFLADFGIRRLELDSRLESNQIADVMTLIFACRRDLRLQKFRRPASLVSRLRAESGIIYACALTKIEDDTLSITYSYCMTRFSRLVAWFKKRQRHLRDHRALFRAAPRYGVILGLAPLGVYLLYYLHGNSWALLIASLLAAVGVFATTYLFFMTVGSLAYDNEEKAFRLDRANQQLQLYADWIRADLDRARAVQRMLLPDFDQMPMADRLEWGTSFVPEEEVGGDYFDAAPLSRDRLAVLFADVSGHGLSAALITALIKATFQSWIERGGAIEDFVHQLNDRLFNLTPHQSFAAVAAAVLDLSRMELSYCNCGHNPEPYLIRKEAVRPAPLDGARNLILGVMDNVEPTTASIQLRNGDVVFFATDGITEASNLFGEEFSIEGLEDFLAENRGLPMNETVERLVDTIERYSKDVEDNDDRAVLAFRVR
jgi:serine phosphatase RsbU (regulator of sigma subunit)